MTQADNHDPLAAAQALSPNDLALLVTLAESGSLTAAALRLGVSQPAVTKQLRCIERAVRAPLFTRTTRGIQPNEYGLVLLPHARIIRDQATRAVNELAQRLGERERHIQIALSHLPIIAFLPQVMRRFRELWPEVEVRIGTPVYPERFYGLREGSPDFAIVPLPMERLPAEYSARPMYRTNLVSIVRRGHPLAGSRRLADLVHAHWVTPGAGSTSSAALRRAFERNGLPPPRCPVTSETLTGLESLVASSDLVGIVPQEVHEIRANETGLCRVAQDSVIESPSLAMIQWTDAQATPAAACLAELFVEVAHRRAREMRVTADFAADTMT